MILLRILKESVLFAISALVSNKVRTILSLLGVTIGIFAIISVLTAVDSLEHKVRADLSDLGEDVVYIQKWPWGGGGNMPWWKYMNRPNPTYKDYLQLSKKYKNADAICIGMHPGSKSIKYKTNSVNSVDIVAVSHTFKDFGAIDISDGRFFSPVESSNGNNVVVLGADISNGIFDGIDPIGKYVKIFGRKLRVIGVFKKEGTSTLGNSKDQQAFVPLVFLRKQYNINAGQLGSYIMVRPKKGISITQLKDELTGKMRSIRRLRPKEDDDFSLNELSVISGNLESFFGILNMAGILIGGFSILVGGFGIANIMFVSVRERTNIIGIQKSLGAKNYFILSQFLVESVILSLLGGIFGLAMVYGITFVITKVSGMEIFLGLNNIMIGLSISVSIGLIAGIVPAWLGAKMNPVDAIRTGI